MKGSNRKHDILGGAAQARTRLPLRRRVILQKNKISKLQAQKRIPEEGFGRQLWLQKWAFRPSWRLLGKFFGGKLAPKTPSQAMDKGGGRDDTKQVENVRPRIPGGRRDVVPENSYLGSENHERPQLQRVF